MTRENAHGLLAPMVGARAHVEPQPEIREGDRSRLLRVAPVHRDHKVTRRGLLSTKNRHGLTLSGSRRMVSGMKKKHKPPGSVGRPLADNPLNVRHLVRVTEDDDRAAREDMERLAEITGVEWDFSMYTRMCLRQMRGKHLNEGSGS